MSPGAHDQDHLQNELNFRYASRRQEGLKKGCDWTSRGLKHRCGAGGGSSALRSKGGAMPWSPTRLVALSAYAAGRGRRSGV